LLTNENQEGILGTGKWKQRQFNNVQIGRKKINTGR
jgi:hypothetical protein